MKKLFLIIAFLFIGFQTVFCQNIRIDQVRELPDTIAYLRNLNSMGDTNTVQAFIRDSLGRFWDSTEVKAAMNDTLDYSLRTYAVNLFDYIGAFDTSTSWTNVFQSALTSLAGSGKILYVPGNYKYTLTNAGNNPYAGSHDYCLDLKTGGYTIQGGQGAILYLKDAQQTDASGALDIIVGKTMSNFAMRNLIVIGNTAGQIGWTGGYAQITSGCIIRVYGDGTYTLNKNLTFENLTLYDHWSNPIDVLSTDGLIYRNCKTWAVGEGFEAITCRNILFDNLNVNDSTNVFEGDGIEISACRNFIIQNCTVEENGNGTAFDLYGSQDGTLKDFYIENWSAGISLGTHDEGMTVNNVSITDGIIKNTPGVALYGSEGGVVYDNIIVDSAGLGGFQINVGDSTALTTQIIKNSIFKRCAPSYVYGNRSLKLENCTFDSSYSYALVVIRSFANATPEIEIKYCTFSNSSGWGIYENNQGDATFAPKGTVSYNTFINNTSGDITKIDSSDVKYLFNQSTTEYSMNDGYTIPYGISPANCSITSAISLITINYGSENQILNIRFGAAVTVRDNDYYGSGNINLANDIDYAFASGDYLTLRYNSTTKIWDEVSRMTYGTVSSFGNNSYFNHDNFGGNRLFNPLLEDYFHAATSRFTVSDTGFTSLTKSELFNGIYGDFGTIADEDTGKIYIDLTAKSELTSNGLTYTEGYVYLHFRYTNIPASISGAMLLKDSTNWTSLTNITNVTNEAGYAIYRMTVPTRNYVLQFRFFIVGNTGDTYPSEIEYYPFRTEADFKSPSVIKSQANSLYNKLSFKNFNNTEKAYVDSSGNAYFQDLTVANTITVTDSVVTQSYTTDTLTVNNISTLAAATATTLTVGTITSTNGRIQPASGGQIELDSLRNRVAKLDTLNYGFSIADVADASYSGAIFTTMPITVTMVRAVLRTTVDGTEDTAKCNIYFSTDISTGSPNKLWSTDKNVVDSTTGTTYSSFDDATIPAYSWIWMNCSAEEGTVNQLNMTVFARKD